MSPTDIFMPPISLGVFLIRLYTYISNTFLLQVFFFPFWRDAQGEKEQKTSSGWLGIDRTNLRWAGSKNERRCVCMFVCMGGSWLSCTHYRKTENMWEWISNIWSVPFVSQLRPNPMKEKEKWNPFGPSSEFIIRKRAIFLISSTKGKPLAEVRQAGSFISPWKDKTLSFFVVWGGKKNKPALWGRPKSGNETSKTCRNSYYRV